MTFVDRTSGALAPLVSVAMTAYNSEPWIARALESALAQQTPFPVEIVVGDDCSRDNTTPIVREYEARYPGRIRLLQRDKQLGMQRNFFETFEQCRGRYIAWLDADDCWTHPGKLALQAEILDSDASIAVCGHFARTVRPSGEVVTERFPSRRPGRYKLKDVVIENIVPSLSMMFRNGLQRSLGPWFFQLTGIADWPIVVAGALQGDVYLLDGVMADYNSPETSAYNAKGYLYQHQIDMEFREAMLEYLPAEWHRHVRAGMGKEWESLAWEARTAGNYPTARRAALNAMSTPSLRDNGRSKLKALAAAIAAETARHLRRKAAVPREHAKMSSTRRLADGTPH